MVESDESVVAQILRAHGGALAATNVVQVVEFVTHHLERLELSLIHIFSVRPHTWSHLL